jgi:hypothetical protein
MVALANVLESLLCAIQASRASTAANATGPRALHDGRQHLWQPASDRPSGEEPDRRARSCSGRFLAAAVETVSAMEIVLGGGVIDRRLTDAVALLRAYREDEGTRYLNQVPITPPDRLVPEDLAVRMLINSRVGLRAYKSVQDLGSTLDLSVLPTTPLEQTNAEQRGAVADLVAQVAHWPGFAASVASKVLHKKRAALVPLLDNSAIFGAYMNRPGLQFTRRQTA